MRLVSLHADTVRALERLRVPFDDLTPEGLWGSPFHLIGLTPEQRTVLDSWNLGANDITPRAIGAAGDVAPQLKETWPAAAPTGRADAPARETRAAPAPSTQRPEARLADVRRDATDLESDSEVAVPMHEEPKPHGDPLEREIIGAAVAASTKSDGPGTNESADAPMSAPGTMTNGAASAANTEATATAAPLKLGASKTAAFTPPAAPAKADPTRLRISVGGKYREATVQRGKILLDGKTFDSPAQASKSVSPAKGDWVFWEYFDASAGKWRMLDRDWSPSQATN